MNTVPPKFETRRLVMTLGITTPFWSVAAKHVSKLGLQGCRQPLSQACAPRSRAVFPPRPHLLGLSPLVPAGGWREKPSQGWEEPAQPSQWCRLMGTWRSALSTSLPESGRLQQLLRPVLWGSAARGPGCVSAPCPHVPLLPGLASHPGHGQGHWSPGD